MLLLTEESLIALASVPFEYQRPIGMEQVGEYHPDLKEYMKNNLAVLLDIGAENTWSNS